MNFPQVHHGQRPGRLPMTIRLVLAAIIATLAFAPAAAAEEGAKPGVTKSKPAKASKKKARRASGEAKKPDDTGQYYSTQKDEMTR
jgi:hypothetical protein